MTLPAQTQLSPVAVRDRLHFLDIVRGFAMLGIIMVNYFLIASSGAFASSSGETITQSLVHWFAEGKFYTLFSFLFGIGFIIFMNRAEARFESPRIVFVRRLVALFGFGLLHIAFIWSGDILTYYAVAGLLLLLFYKCRPATLLIWAVVLLLAYSLFSLSWMLQPTFLEGTDFAAEATNTSYLVSIGERFSEVKGMLSTSYTMLIPMLMMFLVGMYFVKKGLFHQMESKKKQWTRIWSIFTILFVAIQAFTIWNTWQGSSNEMSGFGAADLVSQVSGIVGSLFYMSSLALLFLYVGKLRPLLMLIGNVGRMSLTCYLLHSMIGTFLFFDYGLGLGKMLPPTGVASVGFGVFILLIVLSTVWMKYFKYGPVEWLWRKLTYGKMDGLRGGNASANRSVVR
ncbi:DUF418 domain-containing protein [Paenibacillus hunanensis]|uniref:DUF418 domain-containing protein n=1 Tax=Paenibacillus hunanensis TaxID=539262 RepID=A0ABU1IYG5_9BACL|nr:DUF418 domain-containing protein [Paenibacillus hunanensis]MDR6244299.1 uncharacterized protein [Paenibacillus hunanensis]GGJ17827.1 hypothetical protein GCM10008022_28890 [Paenibacillus hunanensis]